MNELIEFSIPKGYKFDSKRSTPEKLVYILQEKPIAENWNEVCEVMFPIGGNLRYVQDNGQVGTIYITSGSHNERNNVTSKAQGEKLMAINQLLTVAKYLNSLEDFKNIEGHFAIIIESNGNITTGAVRNCDFVYFKGSEAANIAIKILGEDIIRLALTPNNY